MTVRLNKSDLITENAVVLVKLGKSTFEIVFRYGPLTFRYYMSFSMTDPWVCVLTENIVGQQITKPMPPVLLPIAVILNSDGKRDGKFIEKVRFQKHLTPDEQAIAYILGFEKTGDSDDDTYELIFGDMKDRKNIVKVASELLEKHNLEYLHHHQQKRKSRQQKTPVNLRPLTEYITPQSAISSSGSRLPPTSTVYDNSRSSKNVYSWVALIIITILTLVFLRRTRIRNRNLEENIRLIHSIGVYNDDHWKIIGHALNLSKGKPLFTLPRFLHKLPESISLDDMYSILVIALEYNWVDVLSELMRNDRLRDKVREDRIIRKMAHSLNDASLKRRITRWLRDTSFTPRQYTPSPILYQQPSPTTTTHSRPSFVQNLLMDLPTDDSRFSLVPVYPLSPAVSAHEGMEGLTQILNRFHLLTPTFPEKLQETLLQMFPSLHHLNTGHVRKVVQYLVHRLIQYGTVLNKNIIAAELERPSFLKKLYMHIVKSLLLNDGTTMDIETTSTTFNPSQRLQQEETDQDVNLDTMMYDLFLQQHEIQRRQQQQLLRQRLPIVQREQQDVIQLPPTPEDDVRIPVFPCRLHRLPAGPSQDRRFTSVTDSNIRKLNILARKNNIAQILLANALERNINYIYIVDGPNYAYRLYPDSFLKREKYISSELFRKVISESVRTTPNIFLIVSQKNWTIDSKSLLSFDKNPHTKDSSTFFYVRVGCRNDTTKRNCASEFNKNECDDFVRKDIMDQLRQMTKFLKQNSDKSVSITTEDGKRTYFRGHIPASVYIKVIEKTEDRGRNWRIQRR